MGIKRMRGISPEELRAVVATIFGQKSEDVAGYIIIGWPASEGALLPMITTDAARAIDALHCLGVVIAGLTKQLMESEKAGE